MEKVYLSVRLAFIAAALNTAAAALVHIIGVTFNSICTLAAGAVCLIAALIRLRRESRRFFSALKAAVVYMVLLTAAVVFLYSGAAAAVFSEGAAELLSGLVFYIIAVLFLGAVIISDFTAKRLFFAALEELRKLRDIAFPPRRIMRCFYLFVIIALLSAFSALSGSAAPHSALWSAAKISGVIAALLHFRILYLMYTYLSAVDKKTEEIAEE